ncbi:MAG: hypothetical protein ACTSRS_14685 [Candidatus Helarchaeota archaeon]
MSISEERQCHHCGTFHLRNISFFAYWVQCEKCGIALCPRCSGYHNPRTSQFAFLVYMVISFLFYIGIILILGPIISSGKGLTILNNSYFLAALLFIPPFFGLILIIHSIHNTLKRQSESVLKNCPVCGAALVFNFHDIFLYFWLFLIHILYITTILNETGIFFYRTFPEFGVPAFTLTTFFLILLIGSLFFIIFFFKRVGQYFLTQYKTNTRVWLGEIFAVCLYIALSVIWVIVIPLDDTLFSFDLFYNFTSIASWFFPVFLLAGFIYKSTQKITLSIKRSTIIQIIVAMLYIIAPFFIWGYLSVTFNLYSTYVPLNKISLTLYSPLFNELVPLFCLSFLLGTFLTSLFKKRQIPKFSFTPQFLNRILLFFCSLLLIGFLLLDSIYYLSTGMFLLDACSPIFERLIIGTVLFGIIVLIFYELLSNWVSSQSGWGRLIETHLGSLLYPLLLGFLFTMLSFSFPSFIQSLSTIALIPGYTLMTAVSTFKSIILVGIGIGMLSSFFLINRTNKKHAKKMKSR